MTTQELIDLLKSTSGNLLSYDLDSYFGETPSEAQIVTLLNQAKNIIGEYLFIVNPSITFTPTANSFQQNIQDTTTPVVSSKVLKPLRVVVNGITLRGMDGYGVMSYGDFENSYPSFRLASSGQPTIAVQLGNGKLGLYMKPDQSYSNSYIVGQVLPADLSASSLSAEPDMPADLHIAIAYLAAVIAAEPTAAVQEQFMRLDRYSKHYRDRIERARADNVRAYTETKNYSRPKYI